MKKLMSDMSHPFDLGAFIREIYNIDISAQPWYDQVAHMAVVRQYKPGDLVQDLGEPIAEVRLLLEGTVRFFVMDYAGVVFTDCFLAERGYPINTHEFGMISGCGISAMTDVSTVCLPLREMMPLLQTDPLLLSLQLGMSNWALQFHWEQKVRRFRMNALQRYMMFKREYPQLDKRTNSRYIAEYIGVAPESLSRLRKALRDGAGENVFLPPDVVIRNKLSGD
jgi:CRP-like cAMP-binding protein